MVHVIALHNRDLDVLEELERMLLVDVPGETLWDEFERVHRVALKSAGVVRDRANRERKRPLPLNVWVALGRLGARHKERAAEVAKFVAVRQRAEASRIGETLVTRELVEEHRAGTLEYVRSLYAEMMDMQAMAA